MWSLCQCAISSGIVRSVARDSRATGMRLVSACIVFVGDARSAGLPALSDAERRGVEGKPRGYDIRPHHSAARRRVCPAR